MVTPITSKPQSSALERPAPLSEISKLASIGLGQGSVSTVSSLGSNDIRASIEAQLKTQFEAQKAEWKKQREALETNLKNTIEEFADLPWYQQAFYYIPVEVKKALLKVQIWHLSLLESSSVEKLISSMKQEIDTLVKEFEESVKGNPDKQTPNPFDPNAPPLTPGFPVVDAKGNASIQGGEGPSLITWLFKAGMLLQKFRDMLLRFPFQS